MISVSWIARRARPPVHGTVALASIKGRRAQARGLTTTVNVLRQHLNTLGLGGWSFLAHWNGIQLYLCIGTWHTPKKLFWLSNVFKWPEIFLCMKTQNNRKRRRRRKNPKSYIWQAWNRTQDLMKFYKIGVTISILTRIHPGQTWHQEQKPITLFRNVLCQGGQGAFEGAHVSWSSCWTRSMHQEHSGLFLRDGRKCWAPGKGVRNSALEAPPKPSSSEHWRWVGVTRGTRGSVTRRQEPFSHSNPRLGEGWPRAGHFGEPQPWNWFLLCFLEVWFDFIYLELESQSLVCSWPP